MSRMNHVMQIGVIEGKVRFYLEDYAYTYLKKQEKTEKKKYFLYGEREEKEGEEKLYIYGISDSPKTEFTYFKEYEPLGFFRYKHNERYWVNIKGQEKLLQGFYVFYAPNNAMQEYLIDTSKQNNEADKPQMQNARKLTRENPPIKETFVTVRKKAFHNKNKRYDIRNFMMPAGVTVAVLLFATAFSTPNGQQKIQIFKQIISDVMNDTQIEEEFIVEDKRIDEETDIIIETMNPQDTDNISVEDNVGIQDLETNTEPEADAQQNSGVNLNITEDAEAGLKAENEESITTKEENIKTLDSEQINYEEYIVQEGDTLAAICKNKYGSLIKMEEICNINNIKNADYIAPGQKLYLP